MKYLIRKGVVLEYVCGRPLLIATLEARKYCPYLVELNDASVYIWSQLLKENSSEEIAASVAVDFDLTMQQAENIVDDFISELKKQHYLIPEMEEE